METEATISTIVKQDKIYADTCALMHVHQFKMFLERYGKLLLQYNKQINIHRNVQKELLKLVTGQDEEKRELAGNALNLIRSRGDIFYIEGGLNSFTPMELQNAFFDKALLSNLIYNRPERASMLITNDSALINDLLLVNQMQSVKGKDQTACRINENGVLLVITNDDTADAQPEEIPKIAEVNDEDKGLNEKIFSQGLAIGVGTGCLVVGAIKLAATALSKMGRRHF